MAPRVLFLSSIWILGSLLQSCSESMGSGQVQSFNAAAIEIHLQNGLAMKNHTLFTGIIYKLQENKKDTAEIVRFNNGREHGTWKRFYPDGKLMETRHFDNGQKAGAFYAWWPNGILKLAYHFENGEYNGLCREWNDQKMLIREMHYKAGYESGSQKEFYNDGKVKANYIMTDGRRYGLLGTKNCVNVTDSIFKN